MQNMSLKFTIEKVIGRLIGFGLALLISLVVVIKFVTAPVQFIKINILKLKKRDTIPKCLKDLSLGEHGFARLKVSCLLKVYINGRTNELYMYHVTDTCLQTSSLEYRGVYKTKVNYSHN